MSREEDLQQALEGVDVLKDEKRGSLHTITVRASREEIMARFATVDTIFFEALPLSLEEIFISETEVAGYDIKKIIFSKHLPEPAFGTYGHQPVHEI